MIPIFVSCQPEHASLSHYPTICQICDLLQVLLYQYGKKPACAHTYMYGIAKYKHTHALLFYL